MGKLVRACIEQAGYWVRDLRIAYLRLAGVRIGRNTLISMGAKIDVTTEGVVIGDHCQITYGCVILAHDYAAATKLGKVHYRTPCVEIRDNVFVGVNSVILPNVCIGPNSIVAAGSVVTKDVPANVIVAGNPAKVIKTIPAPGAVEADAPPKTLSATH